MKKLPYLLILLCLIASPAFAFTSAIQAVCGASGGVACGETDDKQETTANIWYFGRTTGTSQYIHTTLTITDPGIIKTVWVSLRDAGSPTATITLNLCTQSGGNPDVCTPADAVLGNGSSTPTTGTCSWYPFHFSSGYSMSATGYNIRLNTTQSSDTDYYMVCGNNTVTGQSIDDSPDGSTWNTQDSSGQLGFKLSTCGE